MKGKSVDKIFLTITIILTVLGILCFFSASLGVLARSQTKFYNVLISQLAFGVILGIVALYIASRINYTVWKKYAFYIFVAALIIMPLVFIPGLGFEHGGARRWISLGFISFQPAEFLKIAFVIYFAAWLSWVRNKVDEFRFGTLPLIIILSLMAGLLFLQPDTKSFILMLIAGVSMLFVSGVPLKFFGIIFSVGVLIFALLAFTTPYIQSRIKTFIHPSHDASGASYQLQQSLIAFGSGGFFGRGFGQSVQKFGYLPEPQGDSIFAVIGEEFGFIGTLIFVLLYVGFALRGLRIAYYAPDQFSRLLVIGIVTILTFQSFLNIASLIGLFPLTGVPLVFVSQGGTSLLFAFFAVGIVLNVSRSQKSKKKV